jgi:hypothetical protein
LKKFAQGIFTGLSQITEFRWLVVTLRGNLKFPKFGKLVLAQNVARRRSAWVVQFPKFNALQ